MEANLNTAVIYRGILTLYNVENAVYYSGIFITLAPGYRGLSIVDKPLLEGQKLGQVFNSRCGRVPTLLRTIVSSKQPNL